MRDLGELGEWLATALERRASDLYLTVGAPPLLRGDGGIIKLRAAALTEAELDAFLGVVAGERGVAEFRAAHELNLALDLDGRGRFRINAFRQRQRTGMVVRRIPTDIPTLEQLGLPDLLGRLCLEKRGLVFMVGGTGSGKSTSLAAMIDYRNRREPGHIVTIEDPIEFVHDHRECIVTQREVGIDTLSVDAALKNVLRQKPDLILIGEIRDAAAMEHAIVIAETGHLCLATLHANNANQAIERVLNFFPHERHDQLLLNLSLNLRAVVSQRLVATVDRRRAVALEIMLNQGLVRELVRKGEARELKAAIAQAQSEGMRTFDQSLVELALAGRIAEEVAIAEADSAADVRLALQQARLGAGKGLAGVDTSRLSLG